MNFDILRQKILEKAIRGELVPQLESEPEVSQIGEVSEDVPFAIPKKWKWVRVSDVSHINPKVTAQTSNTEVSFIPMAALSAGYVNQIALDTTRLWGAVKNGYTKFADGDILLAKITPCFQNRKSAIARKLSNGIGCGSSEFHILRVSENIVTQEYLLMFLKSQWFITYGVENFKGTAGQQRLGTSELKNCLFSLPPLSEQHRIVAKVNQLFNLIDCTENAYNELSGPLSERFRQLCLEKAIQGKLVPQLESEPVVNQIGDVPDNCPFRLPKKWKWVKLGAAFSLKAGKFISASEIKDSGAYPCYGGNGKRGYVDKFNREGRFPLIGRQGALCGNINLVDGKFYATEHAVVADGGNIIDPDCAAFFLKALNLNQYATKTAQPGLSVKRISKTPFPLAPIQEQKRIVKKIQDLLLEISSIKQS